MLIDDKADYDEHSCVFVKNYVDEKSILFKSKNDFLIISLGWGYRLSDFSVVIKKNLECVSFGWEDSFSHLCC